MIALIFGVLTVLLLAYCLICMLSSKKYEAGLSRVSQEDFPLKRFMAIGLNTQKMLIKMTGNNHFFIGSKDVRRKLGIIYGDHQMKFYSMVYSADALTYIVLFLMIGCMLVAGTGMIEMLVLVLILEVAIVAMLLPKRLDEYVEKRQQAIRMEFPDFLSKYILLLGAGMSVTEAWSTAGKVENMDTPFYREVALTNHEINALGKPAVDALRSFSIRMRDGDINRFISSVIQFKDYGGSDLAEVLSTQSSEAWKNRKQEALRLGEVAGTKLTGTMLLMFLAIIVLVMAPALMTMNMGL